MWFHCLSCGQKLLLTPANTLFEVCELKYKINIIQVFIQNFLSVKVQPWQTQRRRTWILTELRLIVRMWSLTQVGESCGPTFLRGLNPCVDSFTNLNFLFHLTHTLLWDNIQLSKFIWEFQPRFWIFYFDCKYYTNYEHLTLYNSTGLLLFL